MTEQITEAGPGDMSLSCLISVASNGEWESVQSGIAQLNGDRDRALAWAEANRHIGGSFEILADLILEGVSIEAVAEDENL